MLVLVLAGCGPDEPEIVGRDPAILDLEAHIVDDVTTATGGVETLVGCPDEAAMEANTSFDCWVAQANGQTGLARVVIDAAGVATWSPVPNAP